MALRVRSRDPPSCCPSPLPPAPRPRGVLWAGEGLSRRQTSLDRHRIFCLDRCQARPPRAGLATRAVPAPCQSPRYALQASASAPGPSRASGATAQGTHLSARDPGALRLLRACAAREGPVGPRLAAEHRLPKGLRLPPCGSLLQKEPQVPSLAKVFLS